ncbi:MAG: hypothetical protein D6689_11805 [Deltaproteobacteria bacterium]|nr:MAG: hypothetical protein D6689_11805 [Deltaproteobacteria bacterium]
MTTGAPVGDDARDRGRLECVGRVAPGVAHDVSSAAASLGANVEVIRQLVAALDASPLDWIDLPELRDAVDDMMAAVARIRGLVRSLAQLATVGRGEPKAVDACEVVQTAAALTAAACRAAGGFHSEIPHEPAIVTVDPGALLYELVAAVLDARDLLGRQAGGHAAVTLAATRERGGVRVRVTPGAYDRFLPLDG